MHTCDTKHESKQVFLVVNAGKHSTPWLNLRSYIIVIARRCLEQVQTQLNMDVAVVVAGCPVSHPDFASSMLRNSGMT
jgi:hypothetical protein